MKKIYDTPLIEVEMFNNLKISTAADISDVQPTGPENPGFEF